MRLFIIVGLIIILIYFLTLLYPFYQRYWVAITDGQKADGQRFVNNLETIASGLSFNDAEKLAAEMKKPIAERTVKIKVGDYEISPAWVNNK